MLRMLPIRCLQPRKFAIGKKEREAESAHVSVESSSNAPSTDVALTTVCIHLHKNDWICDTAASSHMTSNIDKFETISVHNGTVEVGGGLFLEY